MIGLVRMDLAQSVFALHGVDESGKARLVRLAVRRDQRGETVAKLRPCTIGMETYSGAHHWAWQFMAFGHTLRPNGFERPARPHLLRPSKTCGCETATQSKVFAAPVGSRRPCSQS